MLRKEYTLDDERILTREAREAGSLEKQDRLKASLLDYYTGRELVCTDYLDNEGNIEIKRGYQM